MGDLRMAPLVIKPPLDRGWLKGNWSASAVFLDLVTISGRANMLLGCLTQKIQLNMKNKLTFTGYSFAEDSGLKCQAVILY